MTWSKQYTSAVAVDDVDSDGGVSLVATVDELIGTWLPSRGWTTATQSGTRPNSNTGLYHWWMDKSIQCLDGSYYNHRVELTLNPNSSEHFGYRTWNEGVIADTLYQTPLNNDDNLAAAVEGYWEFWTSDQDSDSFLIITQGQDKKVIAYMPPTASIIKSQSGANNSPLKVMPNIPTSGNGNLWSVLNTPHSIQPAIRSYSPNNSTNGGQVIKFNAQFCNAGIGSSTQPGFVTSTNDCSMLFQAEDTDYMNNVGTLQVGTEFFIRVGLSGNALLFSTGTTDPQL